MLLILSSYRPTFSIILLNKELIGCNWLPKSAVSKWIKVVFCSSSNSEFSGLINEETQQGEH